MARGSLEGGGGLVAWWAGLGAVEVGLLWAGLGGGGAGPRVGAWPAGEGAGRLFREFCRWGRSGVGGARPPGAGFPPEVGGRGLEEGGGTLTGGDGALPRRHWEGGAGEGAGLSSWRWLGGRGASGRVEEEASEDERSLGTPPGYRPVIGGAEPEGLDAALPLAPDGSGAGGVRGAPCWRYRYSLK